MTTAGALLTLPTFLTAFFVLAGPQPAVLAARYGLDVDAVTTMTQAAESDPTILVVGLLFLVGIVFGLPILGIALWRTRTVSIWLAAALVVGAGTHPFVPGHLGQGIGLLLATLGFVGASIALIRTANAAFDLPPVTRMGVAHHPAHEADATSDDLEAPTAGDHPQQVLVLHPRARATSTGCCGT